MRRFFCTFCLFGVGFAQIASACSVCFGGETETRQAFYTTALALTVLPVIMIGGGAYALHRRFRKLAEEEEADGAVRQDDSH